MDKENQIELEATLLLLSEQPEVLVRELATLDNLAGYRLIPQESIQILDTYLDTPEGQIQNKKLGLRIRQSACKTLITLKGQPVTTASGATRRLEIEEAFSESSLNAVLKELGQLGVQLSKLTFYSNSPMNSMQSLGLSAVQSRQNQRIPRQVIRKDSDDALAELVIDSVTYLFGGRSIRHYEVEVESKGKGGEDAIRNLMGALVQIYPLALKPWHHDKLITGKAVQGLLSGNEGTHAFLDSKDNLMPSAYQEIDRYISGNFA